MPKAGTKKNTQKSKLVLSEPSLFLLEKLLVILVLLFTSININTFLSSRFQVLGATAEVVVDNTTGLEEEKLFWQQVVSSNPTYRDGYIELADIYTKLGDPKTANYYLERAKQVDPN